MGEYTYDNIIIDPHKEGIGSLIGKEVYFHDNPSRCLEGANEKSTSILGTLEGIKETDHDPFVIEKHGSFYKSPCIIEKKEELEPEFVPFKSADEFLDEFDEANYSITHGTLENRVLEYGGIWLKSKKDDSLRMAAGVQGDGLVICDKDTLEYNAKMSWDEILADFVFLDGTPCGMNSLRRTEDE